MSWSGAAKGFAIDWRSDRRRRRGGHEFAMGDVGVVFGVLVTLMVMKILGKWTVGWCFFFCCVYAASGIDLADAYNVHDVDDLFYVEWSCVELEHVENT